MKQKLLWFVYFFSFHLGIDALFYYLNRQSRLVLTYHNVLPESLFDNSLHLRTSHSDRVFERHLQLINQRWPQSKWPDACLITFDDGYANQYHIAAAILERYGRRGVFFVTLDLIYGRAPLWPDRLMMWLSYVPRGTYQLLDERFVIDDVNSRFDCWSLIWDRILEDYGCIEDLIRAMEAAFPFDRLAIDAPLMAQRFKGMTLEQIEQLRIRCHLIGSHSGGHDVLSRLSRTALEDDFSRCESAVGLVFNCDLYCYPFGGLQEVTEREVIACSKSRFRHAYLNVESLEAKEINKEFAIGRVSLPNTLDRYVIEAKLSGFERALKKLIRWTGAGA